MANPEILKGGLKARLAISPVAELDMDWIHPRIGLDGVGWDDRDPIIKLGKERKADLYSAYRQ